MIVQFVKDDGLSIVCVATMHQHMPLRYRKKISASETVCELQFYVLSRKRVILLLYSLKSFLRSVLLCVATHRSRQKKPLHFAN